jgi:hypothetical protein
MSDIIVKFKPMGQKQLIDAINRLEEAQGKATTTAKKHRLAIGRNRKAMGMFEQSLATVRSRLLVFNFAMSMGIRQLMQFSREAARVQDMSRAFTTLSRTGENSAIAVSKISNAVKGTMSQMDLFKQANNAMILGVTRNTDEMAEMFKIAQTLGAALGVDTAHAVESLITGIGRQSRLMLDNIGIIVKSDDAYKNYAAQLNKTVDQLTDAEKKQAFFTAAMESARTKADELGNQQLTARDRFNQFNATMEDFTNFIGEKTTPIVLDFFDSFGETLKRLTETDLETTIRQLESFGASAENLAKLNKLLGMEQAREQIKQSQKEISKSLEQLIPLTGIEQIEGFGATVEQTVNEIMNSGNTIEAFKVDPKNLNADAVQAEFDRITDMALQFGIGLAATDDPVQKEMFQERIDHFKALAIKYQEIIAELQKMNEANETLDDTNKKVVETNEDIAGSGDKITASLKNQMSAVKSAAKGFAALGKELGMGAKAIAAIQAVGALANAHSAASDVLADKTIQPTALRIAAAAGMYAEGLAHVLAIRNAGNQLGSASSGNGGAVYGKFEHGGYVGGRPHSQGGTIIEAERGEFVMSRNAVESIGLETLNQMNQSGGGGNINVNVSGNVLTQDFVEGELAESIKEAVRRGSDFGIG